MAYSHFPWDSTHRGFKDPVTVPRQTPAPSMPEQGLCVLLNLPPQPQGNLQSFPWQQRKVRCLLQPLAGSEMLQSPRTVLLNPIFCPLPPAEQKHTDSTLLSKPLSQPASLPSYLGRAQDTSPRPGRATSLCDWRLQLEPAPPPWPCLPLLPREPQVCADSASLFHILVL